MSGVLIIVLLIVFSGLIAYLGDRIGMKAGKKRISLFGLRPRYSSIIITVLTGILIAGLSIPILLGVYSSLRQALFNINEVLNRLESLNQQLTQKDQELTEMKKEISQKADELARLQKQKSNLQSKLKTTEKEFEEAKKSLDRASKDIRNLEANRKELQDKVADLSTQRQNLENKVNELNNKIAKLNENYQAVKELKNQYQAGMMYYMGEDIVYQKGDIIYSDVIEGGRSEKETIKDLNKFLQKANEVAKEKQIKVNQDTGMALRLQTEDILNAARVIYNMDPGKKAIVSLVARVNVPRNDWVFANFLLNKNFVVFNRGELIASKNINADQSTDNIEKSLQDLLKTINTKSIKEGLLPDTHGQVGSLDFSRFYQLLQEIKEMTGEVKVNVYASEEIWREDRLSNNIEFSLVGE